MFLYHIYNRKTEHFSVHNDMDWDSLLSGMNKFYSETRDVLLWFKFDNNIFDSSQKNYDKSLIILNGIEKYDTILKTNDKSPSEVALKFDGRTYIDIKNPKKEEHYWVPNKMSVAFWIHGYTFNLPNVEGFAHQFGKSQNSNISMSNLLYNSLGNTNHRFRIKGTSLYIDIVNKRYSTPDIRVLFKTPYTGEVFLEATPLGQTKWTTVAISRASNQNIVTFGKVNLTVMYNNSVEIIQQHNQTIISTVNDINTNNTRGWNVNIEASGDLSFKYFVSDKEASLKILDEDVQLSKHNTWNHIAYTYDGKNIKMYMNGKNIKTSDTISIDTASVLQNTTADLRIGAGGFQNTPNAFLNNNTLLDDVRIYSRDLTEVEINNIYLPNVKVDLNTFYQDVLQSEDLQISSNITSNMKFEIWEDIISNKENIPRLGGPMLDNMFHDNNIDMVPQSKRGNSFEIIDLKKLNSSNSYTSDSMMEKSFQMQLQQQLYNNVIALEDPISDAYLPYSCNIFNGFIKSPEENNNDYDIISIFKKVLDRNPTSSELLKYNRQMKEGELDASMLKINLINSSEYRRKIKLQSNDVLADVEFKYAKEDLLSYLSRLYYNELEYEIPKQMMLPLKDIFIYLQNNEYLLRALLNHDNYPLFEKDVIDMKLLTKTKLGEYFEKYFILYDLKLSANDIKRHDILERKSKTTSLVTENNTIPSIVNTDLPASVSTIDLNIEPVLSNSTTTALPRMNLTSDNVIDYITNKYDMQMTVQEAQQNQDSTEHFTNIINQSDRIFSY